MAAATGQDGTRRVVVSTFLTLDGVMQGPGGADEDPSGGFEHGGWQMPYVDEAAIAAIGDGMAAAEGLLLGRRTYDIFAAFWPNQSGDDPMAAQLNAFDKYVVSDRLDEAGWENSTLIRGDELVARVTELKQQPGKDLMVIGSGELAGALMRHDLVDEYQLMIHPLVLGSGKRLFEGLDGRMDLELVDTQTTQAGVVILTYRPARDPSSPEPRSAS